MHAAVEPLAAAEHRMLTHQHLRRDALAGGHQLGGPVALADVFHQRIVDVALAGFLEGFVAVEHGRAMLAMREGAGRLPAPE